MWRLFGKIKQSRNCIVMLIHDGPNIQGNFTYQAAQPFLCPLI